MSSQTFSSLWDAIEDTPEQTQNMALRSALMMTLKDHSIRAGISQADAARHFCVTQPCVSDLMHGKINLFSLDALINMAVAANLRIDKPEHDLARQNRIIATICPNAKYNPTPPNHLNQRPID